jgi:hypothetical protein
LLLFFIRLLELGSLFESESSDRIADAVLMLDDGASGAKDSTWWLVQSTARRVTSVDGKSLIS